MPDLHEILGTLKERLDDLDRRLGLIESKALIQGLMEETHERLEPAVCEKCGKGVVMEELFLFTCRDGALSVCESCLKGLKENLNENSG